MDAEWAVRALFAVAGVIAGVVAGVRQNGTKILQIDEHLGEVRCEVSKIKSSVRRLEDEWFGANHADYD